MARAELNKAIADFELIVAKMRDLGVARWDGSPCGDILLGAPPITATQRANAAAERDPKAQRRAYYADVLGRPVTDAEVEKLP